APHDAEWDKEDVASREVLCGVRSSDPLDPFARREVPFDGVEVASTRHDFGWRSVRPVSMVRQQLGQLSVRLGRECLIELLVELFVCQRAARVTLLQA